MVEVIKNAVSAENKIVFAEYADYLEGKITFSDLMDILILDLDDVDE